MRRELCWKVEKLEPHVNTFSYRCLNDVEDVAAIDNTIAEIQKQIKKLTPVASLVNSLRKELKELETLKKLILQDRKDVKG